MVRARGKIDFHFPERVCFSLSGASLVPRQTARRRLLFFFLSLLPFRALPLSIRSSPPRRTETSTMFYFVAEISIVTEVFYVLSSVLPLLSPPLASTLFLDVLAKKRERYSVLLIILILALFPLVAVGALAV